VILVDTSAWVAHLRADDSPADLALTRLVESDGDVALTEPVVMELLAGSRDRDNRRSLRRFIARFEVLPVWGLDDYEAAGDMYAAFRRRGVTIRSIVDCLIAQVAIRNEAPLLHADRDFVRIAEWTPLQLFES
jgi:predicted nucleic acid-binding protein